MLLFDPLLVLTADVLDDLEKTHNANRNRLRQLTRTAADSDGEERGFGLDESNPHVARLAAMVDQMAGLEKEAVKDLERAMKAHPLGPWVKAQKGIGDKQAARLLASIGDPYWNTLHDRPRTVSELWAYCGLDVRAGQGPRKRRGQACNWSQDARKRIWLISRSIIQCRGDYRAIYYDRKEQTEGRLHAAECPQCVGSSKKGEPWRDGHRDADATRVLSKAVLKDLWVEAKRIHEETESHSTGEAHTRGALVAA